MERLKVALAALAIGLGAMGTAQAASVYGESANLTGSRSVAGGGLLTNSTTWEDASISWLITANNGYYAYEYSIDGLGNPALSHFVLDFTDDAFKGDSLADPHAIYDATVNGASVKLEYTAGSFPHEPGITGAVKFDDLDVEDDLLIKIAFKSNRAPVWGDFYGKGGKAQNGTPPSQNNGPPEKAYLVNTAYASADLGILSDVDNFIARPNGNSVVVVPTPAAVWGGLILMGALGLKRYTRGKQTRE